MSFFNKLADSRNNGDIELVSVVKKLDRGDDGVFARIQNDLAAYIEEAGESEDSLRLMAYAYARRAAGAGLFLQNIWGRDEYTHTFKMFNGLQSITQQRKNIVSGTQQGIAFQNKAAKQAIELLKSYNPRLTHELVYCMVSVVETGDVPNLGMVVSDDFVLGMTEEILRKTSKGS